jgi:hypothetical protein
MLVVALCALGPVTRWAWTRTGGLDGADSTAAPVTSALVFGILSGLYCGCIVAADSHDLSLRLSRNDRLGMRCLLLAAHILLLGACGFVGEALSGGSKSDLAAAQDWPGWALSVVLLTALAAALLPWFTGGGRCFLAVVAVAWWIPAVLPPSFLVAVPRALRGAFEGGRALALPSDPIGWLADTALAAGLLLLAWAPRRATFRGDEVRHPG